MLSKVNSFGLFGIDGYKIEVEIDINNGLPSVEIVGLPDTATKESKERVRSAIKNSGFNYPMSKITINLAPADTKKEGSVYDLAIAIGILRASEQINANFDDCIFLGELSLDGKIRRVNGIVPIIISAKAHGYTKIIISKDNVNEAQYIIGLEIFAFESLRQVVEFLTNPTNFAPIFMLEIFIDQQKIQYENDFKYVKGQFVAKRALEIAAAGGHNLLMIGPPGGGKTMLAKCLPSILPDMTMAEALETTKIHSIAGILADTDGIVCRRPFRMPHHTASKVAITGGGLNGKPGEISLAHNGVLFLDEMPEYPRATLEILRQPLEDNVISINRISRSVIYPANIMLIASMNPCPCGNYGSKKNQCKCTPAQISRYISKISGPLLDRIDIHIEIDNIEYDDLKSTNHSEDSNTIRERVNKARNKQLQRYENYKNIYSNAKINTNMIEKFCTLSTTSENILREAFERLNLSARAHNRILKVARTIADLDDSEDIKPQHIAESIQYRALDRKFFYDY